MKTSNYSERYAKLREWMKAERESRDLTVRDVGAMLNCHHSIVSKLENDRRRIDILEFADYCAVVGADPLEGFKLVLEQK